MKGTKEQINIWNEIENGTGHVFVYAKAGTGKTHTIVEGAKTLGEGHYAFLAFNKKIATELKKKLPDGVVAKTFHSLGWKALYDSVGRFTTDNNKSSKIIDKVLGKVDYRYGACQLISLMKGSMVSPDDGEAIKKLAYKYWIDILEDDLEHLISYLPRIFTLIREDTKTVDFDDMIWLPLVEGHSLPQFDILFVDEAQDFNEMQRQLIYKCIAPNGRCIVVGDPKQAIYGFRGADSDSMSLFQKQLKESVEFPLTTTWRCPTRVVAEANKFVNDYYAMDGAKEGSVSANVFFDPKPNDMVLCRYNAPLVSAFYNLVLAGKRAEILGRDMQKPLIFLIKRLQAGKELSTGAFATLLNEYFQYNFKKYIADDKSSRAYALEDRVECIRIFMSRCETMAEVIKEIKYVFGTGKEGGVLLSTVHKAKGLEANNVWILATDRMPHPNAKNMSEERNICYVAITRAKENLYYCGPELNP